MRQKSTTTASSVVARRGVVFGWAIRGSFRWGFGWPPFYSQTMQHSSRDDALAGVGDLDAHHLAVGLRAQGHRAGGGGVAEGVGDQVVEYALELGWVYQYGVYVARDFSDEIYALAFGLGVKAREGVGD